MAIIKLKKGAGTPSGLTLAEPAFDLTNNALYVGITGGVKWVGAEVENTSLSTSNIKIPTSSVVKTYVDNNLASGAVTSVSGITGAVGITGTANQISTTLSGKTLTIALPSAIIAPGSLDVIGNFGVTGSILVKSQAGVSFGDADNSNWIALRGPTTAASNVTFTLPNSDGTNGQVLVTNGSGYLSWSSSIVAGSANVTDDNTTSTPQYILFGQTGSGKTIYADASVTPLSYVPSTGALSIPGPLVLNGDQIRGSGNNIVATLYGGGVSLAGGLTVGGNFIASSTSRVMTFSDADVNVKGTLTAELGLVVTPTNGISFASTTGNINTSTGTAISLNGIDVKLNKDLSVTGNATVAGNLTVNGTTTYVNSTVTEIADPIITLGWTGGVNPFPSDDNKDRGIAFKYNSGSTALTGKTGFFGYDDSTGYFTFVPDATITAEVVSGTVGTANFNTLVSSSGTTLSLIGSGGGGKIELFSTGVAGTNENITLSGTNIKIVNTNGTTGGVIRLANSANTFYGELTVRANLAAHRQYLFPDHGGSVVVPSDLGTSGYILKANGTTTQPTWIDPTAAGFTAYGATRALSIQGGGSGQLVYQTNANTTGFVSAPGATGYFLTINIGTGTPTWVDPNQLGFTAYGSTVSVNQQGGAAGNLHYQTAANTSAFTSNAGATGYFLTYNTTSNTPTWVNPNQFGFTAFASTNVSTALDTSDILAYITFVNTSTDGSNQAIKFNTSLYYNASTNYLEANLDGGYY